MHFRVRLQLAEAFGPDNRWFCSKAYGRRIDDKELLLTYYIKNGGAKDFANRYDQAMGAENRWYCSMYHHNEIRDPRKLWEYYMNHAAVRVAGNNTKYELDKVLPEMNVAS